MVYYNIVNKNEVEPDSSPRGTPSKKPNLSPVASISPHRVGSSYVYLKPVDKRLLYKCLMKMEGVELNKRPGFHLRCVEKATLCKGDGKTFQSWLEEELSVAFSEEEVEELLEYIGLHSWGSTFIRDSSFLRKMFEVPTPLSYSSWHSNIDNMQIRSQFRNSLNSRAVASSSPHSIYAPKHDISPDRHRGKQISTVRRNEKVMDGDRRSRGLENLQQKYLTRVTKKSAHYQKEHSETPSLHQCPPKKLHATQSEKLHVTSFGPVNVLHRRPFKQCRLANGKRRDKQHRKTLQKLENNFNDTTLPSLDEYLSTKAPVQALACPAYDQSDDKFGNQKDDALDNGHSSINDYKNNNCDNACGDLLHSVPKNKKKIKIMSIKIPRVDRM